MDGVEPRPIVSITNGHSTRDIDSLSVESALSISIRSNNHEDFSLGLIMRTPGSDSHLIRGFLYSEGIIKSESDISNIVEKKDSLIVVLSDNVDFNPEEHMRRMTMTSSCGVCGKESISNLIHIHGPDLSEEIFVNNDIISKSISSLRDNQMLFPITGGTHACARIDNQGGLISLAEDIGRHNAMDKLIGECLQGNSLPINNEMVIVSGRASFELVQKSLRAGFPILIALGAPSTLSVDIAKEHGMTLIGFAKKNKITVFSGSRRIK